MDTAAEKNVIVPLQINVCDNYLEYVVVKHVLNILTWSPGSSWNVHLILREIKEKEEKKLFLNIKVIAWRKERLSS